MFVDLLTTLLTPPLYVPLSRCNCKW